MPTTVILNAREGGPVRAIQGLLRNLLADDEIDAIFVPRHLPARGVVMPALITEPEMLDHADPVSPSYPMNGARQVARLTRGDLDGKIVAVLRPCEIRAFIELVKLNQGSLHNVVLVGVDCLGAFDNEGFRTFLQSDGAEEGSGAGHDMTGAFLRKAAAGGCHAPDNGGPALSGACRICEHPTPEYADIAIGLFGQDTDAQLLAVAGTPQGQALLNRMNLEEDTDGGAASARDARVTSYVSEQIARRDRVFDDVREATATPAMLAEYLSGCVNCYNCRVACPVCYCKECVFLTDVFDHEPWQYLGWAKQKGALRLPTDTLFFHLTRMAHMSTACVGCGQCSNACPNDIPVMELFRSVSRKTQQAFEYEAGRDPQEKPPLAVFHEKEFSEVTDGLD